MTKETTILISKELVSVMRELKFDYRVSSYEDLLRHMIAEADSLKSELKIVRVELSELKAMRLSG